MRITKQHLQNIILEELESVIGEAKNKAGKEQGIDGKACWKGYRYAGTEGGKDKCVKMEEEITDDEEEEMEKISKELSGASKMHKGQSDRIKKALKEKKNCGCGQDPCKTYGKIQEETVNEEDIEEKKSAAWQRKAGKNKEGGLNRKGRKSYEKENPGSDLKPPVSKKTAKKNPKGKAAKRRKSFCARMKGMKKKRTRIAKNNLTESSNMLYYIKRRIYVNQFRLRLHQCNTAKEKDLLKSWYDQTHL